MSSHGTESLESMSSSEDIKILFDQLVAEENFSRIEELYGREAVKHARALAGNGASSKTVAKRQKDERKLSGNEKLAKVPKTSAHFSLKRAPAVLSLSTPSSTKVRMEDATFISQKASSGLTGTSEGSVPMQMLLSSDREVGDWSTEPTTVEANKDMSLKITPIAKQSIPAGEFLESAISSFSERLPDSDTLVSENAVGRNFNRVANDIEESMIVPYSTNEEQIHATEETAKPVETRSFNFATRNRNPPERFAFLPSCYFLHDILFT